MVMSVKHINKCENKGPFTLFKNLLSGFSLFPSEIFFRFGNFKFYLDICLNI